MLPARIPNLLINGATGIAVGMATNIPPHNLDEVCTALHQAARQPRARRALQLCRYIKGPDFPTGGQILNSPDELKEIYKTGIGRGPRCAATWEEGPVTRAGKTIYITSMPYTVEQVARSSSASPTSCSAASCRRCSTCKDVSTDDVRIALELKKDADEKMVMAYLFKHTPLQTELPRQPHVPRPDRATRRSAGPSASTCTQMLWHFLHFRLEVVTRAARARARAR